jgi:hypothetical protein
MTLRILLLIPLLLTPSFAMAAPTKVPKSASPAPTPLWDITKPSSCSVQGPPPCAKCTVTCSPPHSPKCIPGDSSSSGGTLACVRPTSCTCK